MLCQSCIVADPPEFRDPVQTRPVLDTLGATPLSRQVVAWSANEPPIQFTVPVQSEDAGENLAIRFFLDYGTDSETVPSTQTLPASTFDGPPRTVTYVWTPPRAGRDCHVMTLVVAHASSFKDNNQNELKENANDAALLSWWINLNPASQSPNTLVNCPSGLPTVP